MTKDPIELIAVFPSLSGFGGVQASGREACLAISRLAGAESISMLHCDVNSKGTAVLSALRNRRRASTILVWHLGLLKLIPLLKRPASRLVLFLHGIEGWRRLDLLTTMALRTVDLFLSNSNYTWERFLDWHPRFRNSRHQTIPLGLGERLAGPTPEPAPYPIALMVGRIEKSEDYKGHREMIQAWPLVLKHLPDAELCILGDGDLRADLESLALSLGVGDRVRFSGPVSDTEKDKMIRQSRCLVLPSRGEGFGLVYLEAMRMGRPCLVSTLDAGREVVNPPEAGLSVDPSDRAQLCSTAIRLLRDGAEWINLSERSRARYERGFTAEHFHTRFAEEIVCNLHRQ